MRKPHLSIAFLLISTVIFCRCSKDKTTENNNNTIPEVTTAAISEIRQTTAICGGHVTSDGGDSVYYRGVCWSTNPIPTYADTKTYDGSGTGAFASQLSGLDINNRYYVRAFAMNDAGLGYGAIDSFRTLDSAGTVTDIDGNIYATIKIGSQWWMAENLKAIHYRNNVDIPNVIDTAAWQNSVSGAYCNYDNDTNQVAIYGRLYNWLAAVDSNNLAPVGWHVPSDSDWQTLVDFLGGEDIAGGKMKESGTEHWLISDFEGTNESGFTALPAGFRRFDARFFLINEAAIFWSSTAYDTVYSWTRALYFFGTEVSRSHGEIPCAFSIRCVKY